MTLKKEMPSAVNILKISSNDLKIHPEFLTIEPVSSVGLNGALAESKTPKLLARKHTFQFGAL